MIDTDKYEGHSTGWKRKTNHSTYSIINDDGQKVASVPCYEECNKDSQLVADAPLLLEEVKELRKDNELYLACIHASQFRHLPGSAMSKLNQERFLQRGEEE